MLILDVLKNKFMSKEFNDDDDEEEEITEEYLSKPIKVENFEPYEEGDVADA